MKTSSANLFLVLELMVYDVAVSTETLPLQHDMFTGELVDARTRHTKRQDRERQHPQQMGMFPVGEILQFGVSTRPWLKAMPAPQLELTCQEIRTPEEIERDLLKVAEQFTTPMFAIDLEKPRLSEKVEALCSSKRPKHVCSLGYRLRARRAHLAIRCKNG